MRFSAPEWARATGLVGSFVVVGAACGTGDTHVPDLFERLKSRAHLREETYDRQMRETLEQIRFLSHKSAPMTPDTIGANAAIETATLFAKAADELARSRENKPWWAWQDEALAEADSDKRDAIYQDALRALPENAQLLNSYAKFVLEERGDINGAEALYKRAIEVEPKGPRIFSSYAGFRANVRRDFDGAEELYKRAIELDPKDATNIVRYAQFVSECRERFNAAEALFKRASEVERANDGAVLSSYANFKTARRHFDTAEALHRRAIEASPKDV